MKSGKPYANILFVALALLLGAAMASLAIGPSAVGADPRFLTSVAHDGTLAGDGTTDSILRIANGGVGTAQLANGAVNTPQLAGNAVTGANIAPGQVVKGINGLTDSVTLSAGGGITINSSGNTLTFSYSAAASPDTSRRAILG